MSSRTRAAAAGVLLANAVPHLASALAGRRHLTPVGGRGASAAHNALWAGCNVVAAGMLLRGLPGGDRWDRDLWALEAGALATTAWMAGSERWLRINTTGGQG